MRRLIWGALALLACINFAYGQGTQAFTPTGAGVPTSMPLCNNAAGQAVFCNPAGAAGFPAGATPITASATGTTAAVTATLPGVAGKTTYLCGGSVSPGSATTAITIPITTTGLTNNFTWAVGAPATAAGVTGAIFNLPTGPVCIPASAPNTGIAVTSGALGAGGINNDVNLWGFQL